MTIPLSGDAELPAYGHSTLADLSRSIAAKMGAGGEDRLGLPDADRYILLLIDGLGRRQLLAHRADAPNLAELAERRRTLTAGVPSTTATSLSCLGTGLPPGQHGVVGYSFRGPRGRVMNALTWEGAPSPELIYSGTTLFTRLADAGVTTTNVSLARFEGSGLTRATLGGAETFSGVVREDDFTGRIAQICRGTASGERSFVYAYERSLDHTGHSLGVASGKWRHTLRVVERFVVDMRAALDDDVCLVVTGDHGMIDVPSWHRIIADDHRELMAKVDLLAGEARARQLYTSRPDLVAARWRAHLGERAWVLSRSEALDAGLFGVVDDRVADRIGDVVVLMRGDWAVMTRGLPKEMSLVGMHGSLTPDEMEVPLCVTGGWA